MYASALERCLLDAGSRQKEEERAREPAPLHTIHTLIQYIQYTYNQQSHPTSRGTSQHITLHFMYISREQK